MHKMSTTMHKSAPTNVVTYLKKNRPTANGSIDHKSSQNAKIKENISSAASKIAVIDIEKQNRLSKAVYIADVDRGKPDIGDPCS
jgi:hypothetical protein